MKSNYMPFDYMKSIGRISAILGDTGNDFEELEFVPPRERLTYTNGFFVDCAALFIDIRESSGLPTVHRRPVLAKIYRAFLSEAVAILNGNDNCQEINIVGDCVWAVFDSPSQNEADAALNTAGQLSSVVDILNFKLQKNGYQQIRVGIGMDHGRALMIKAGNCGSGINDVVWMGHVVNQASKLAGCGNKTWQDKQVMISREFLNKLSRPQRLHFEWNSRWRCFHGKIKDPAMSEWYRSNCRNPSFFGSWNPPSTISEWDLGKWWYKRLW